MHSQRSQILAIALLMLCTVAAALLAAVASMGVTLTPPVALAALALSAALFTGVVLLHRALREARWDAGYRLR